MGQEQFNQYIHLLNTDTYFGISVYDLTAGINKIELNKSKEDIIAKYGSIQDFFNGLVAKGIKKISIQPLYKNGKSNGRQSWIKHKKLPFIEVSLVPTAEQSAQPVTTPVATPTEAHTYQSHQDVRYTQPLNGFPGMSLPQMFDLHADSRDKVRLEERNKALESENKRLNEQIYEFKDKEIKWNNSNASSQKNTEIINAVIQNIDKLPSVLNAFKGGKVAEVTVQGLGNPNLPASHNELIKIISETDDYTVNILTRIESKLDNQDFVTKLEELLNT